ncbi:MFS transporter [Oceanobacillus saliphilus]|uniref:MFS transporter n=1 Tax=Oceanobacillus saliphilus TaxID=2925834 RepID=UPI00201D348B|nr:MFS transporter [Oceanobacillus saliphilus]
MTATEKQQPKQNDLIVTILLFSCALFIVSSVYVTTPLTSEFSNIYQVSPTAAAWPTSIFSVFYAIGFLLFGPLSDRFGRKQIILFGLCTLTLVTMAIGLVDSFQWFLLLRGLQGFMAATFAPSALAYVYDVFPEFKIPTVIGFISFGFVTAGIFGQVLAGIVNQTFDWQMVFIVFGCIYLGCSFFVYFFLPEGIHVKRKLVVNKYLQKVKEIFTTKLLLLSYLITVMLLLTFIGMYTVLGVYLSSSPFNLSDKEILIIRALGFIGMLISPFTGYFIKRFGLIPVFRMGLLISVLGLTTVGAVTNLILIAGLTIFYVAGISITFPSIMILVGNLGGEDRAVAASFYTFILFIGATLGPIVATTFMQLGSYFTTLLFLAFLMAIGLIASFFIHIKSESRSE